MLESREKFLLYLHQM